MRSLIVTVASLFLTLSASSALAEDFTKEQIQEIIHDYLVNNPQALIDAMTALKKYQIQQSIAANEKIVEAKGDVLFNNPDSASIGPKDAKVTLVEFYDYNCGACKILYNAIISYLKENDKLRVVFKEYPIFGENSAYSARVAIAVHRLAPDKYFDFHKKLMSYQGRVTPQVTDEIVKKVGLDVEKIKKEAETDKVKSILTETTQLANELGATGTPLVVINKEIIPHALDIDTLRAKVGAASTQE